jgi:threonyl-tRNA synthetase
MSWPLAAGRYAWFPLMDEPRAYPELADDRIPETVLAVVREFKHGTPAAARADLRALRYLQAPLEFAAAGVHALSPSGTILARLISAWRTSVARDRLLGEEVRTPSLYSWREGSPLHSLASAFEDRLFHYADHTILGYGADPGFFGLISRAELTSRHLPLRLFETSQNFRRHQRGELRGLERLAEYDLLEHHTLLAAADAAAEYARQLHIQFEKHGVWSDRFVCFFRILLSAGQSEFDIIRAAAARVPVIFDVLPESHSYWTLTHTFYTAEGISTFHAQLDLANPVRFGIQVKGEERPLAVIHSALASVEHLLLVAVEEALRQQNAELPFWLYPVQVRLIPVGLEHLNQADALLADLHPHVRIDIDDRPSPVRVRIRRAEQEYVAKMVVVGDQWDDHAVRVRSHGGAEQQMAWETLCREVRAAVAGYPSACLGYQRVSRRLPLVPNP